MIRLNSNLIIVNVNLNVTKDVKTSPLGEREMLMKMLYAIPLVLACFSLTTNAALPVKMIKDIEPTVQMVLTEEPCTMWQVPPDHKVFRAYVTDTGINKTAYGCWEMEPGYIVHVDVVLPDERSFYSYRYPASDFSQRPNL